MQAVAPVTKNLPTIHLAPESRAQLIRALGGEACSIVEARILSSLPVPDLRRTIQAKISDLGSPLRRAECDECLKDLALILPRAAMGPDEIDRMLDLYFGLLREAGVTCRMLMSACKAFIMAPKKGKPRFFPDPGELAEMCADEARLRQRSLSALQKSLEVIDGPPPGGDEDRTSDMSARLRELSERMRAR